MSTSRLPVLNPQDIQLLWPSVRQRLIHGMIQSIDKNESHFFYNALSEARLLGLDEKQKSDPYWKAQAFLESPIYPVPNELFLSMNLFKDRGISFEEIGPIVFSEWLFKMEMRLNSSEDFFSKSDASQSGQSGWYWLCHALEISQLGFVTQPLESKQPRKCRPLDHADQAALGKIVAKLIEKAKKEPNIQETLERLIQGRSTLRATFGSFEALENYFKVFTEVEALDKVALRGKKVKSEIKVRI